MLFYENSSIKKDLVKGAERILRCTVSDVYLMKLYGRFSDEEARFQNPDYDNKNFASPIPMSLRLQDGLLSVPSSDQSYQDTRKLFLSRCPDVYCFLKFGIPGTVKDFSLAESVLVDMGFSLGTIAPFTLLLLPAIIQTHQTDTDKQLFNRVSTELATTKYHSYFTYEKFQLFLASIRGYVLNPAYRTIKENPARISSRANAYNAVRILKNDLRIDSILKQIETCGFFYSKKCQTAKALFNELDKNDYKFLQDKSDVLGNLHRLCLELKNTDPQMIIEGIYQIKKDEIRGMLDERTSRRDDNNRKTSADTECSLLYDIFTGNLSKGDSILIVFPSPYFIRKWITDRIVREYRTVIVVPSPEERNLWNLVPATRKCTFHTADSLISSFQNESMSFSRILAFMLEYEGTSLAYPEKHNTPYNLCESFSVFCKDAIVFCLSSDDAFSKENSFSRTFIKHGLQISSMLFLPNTLNNIGPKKKNFWIGRIQSATDPTFGYEAIQNKLFIITPETPSYKFTTSDYLSSSKRNNIHSYLKHPEKKKDKKNNPASVYEFSPEITFKYTASPDKNYPGKMRVTAFYDDCPPELGDIETIKKRTTKTRTQCAEEINDWIENTYPYSLIEKGKNPDVVRSIRETISVILKERYKEKSVSLKTFLYMHSEIETEYSDKQIEMLRNIAATEFGNRNIKYITENTSYTALEQEIPTDRLEELNELLNSVLDHAVVSKNLRRNPFYLQSGDSDRRNTSRALANVRSALSTKTFTREQARRFNHLLRERIDKGDAASLGLFIKFCTGMETAAISVLLWDDWKRIPDFGGHQLQVYKYYTDKPQEKDRQWMLYHNPTKFRCIPCSDELDEILKKWKKRFPSSSYILSKDKESPPVTPKAMNKTFRILMQDMSLEKIASQSIDDIPIALSDYGGDFLRENFRYSAYDVAGMQADEIAYLLGNTPVTTFGIHYCDYQNPSSQHLIKTKLNRIDKTLNNSAEFHAPQREKYNNDGTNDYSFPDSVYPVQINITVQNKEEESHDIELSSEYGMSVYQNEESI